LTGTRRVGDEESRLVGSLVLRRTSPVSFALVVLCFLAGSALATACDTEAGDGITPELAALIEPPGPARVTVTKSPGRTEVNWPGVGADIHHYVVYRRPADDKDWVKVGEVEGRLDDASIAYSFIDTHPPSAGSHFYGVSAVANNYATEPPSPGLESDVQASSTVPFP
jgi:hypothetical protein